MKKSNSLKSLLILSSCALSPMAIANSIISSNPVALFVEFVCPGIQGTTNIVTNFGSYIAGYGTEFILSNSNSVYFRSSCTTESVPHKLTNYSNLSTDYDSTTGKITCTYTSNNQDDPNFSVAYFLTNGRGGTIQSQSNNVISVNLPVGFKKA